MVDPSCSFQGPHQPRAVTNVGKKNLRGRGQMVDVGSGPLDHPHLLARIDQLLHEMAADETRPAGHDRQVVHEPYATLK